MDKITIKIAQKSRNLINLIKINLTHKIYSLQYNRTIVDFNENAFSAQKGQINANNFLKFRI